MKRKLLAIALVAMMGLTACGKSESSEKEKSDKKETETTTEAETTTEEETTEAETTTTAEEVTTEAETTTEKADDADKDKDEKKSDSKPVEGLSEKYADLDNRSFAYNGKVFTVGVNTLQDLVDAGVPFKESDAANFDNNVNKNHSTAWYTIDISKYSHIQFEFGNYTDGNLKEKECVLSYARWYTIYTPRADFEEDRNKEIVADLEDAAKVVKFSFPITMTKADLLANSPEPTEEKESMNSVLYKVDSTVYYGSSGYEFQFEKDSNQLKEVYITWLP